MIDRLHPRDALKVGIIGGLFAAAVFDGAWVLASIEGSLLAVALLLPPSRKWRRA